MLSLLDFNLFGLFCFGKLILLFLGQSSVIKILTVTCPRSSIRLNVVSFGFSRLLVYFCQFFLSFVSSFWIKLLQKLRICLIDNFALQLAFFFEFFEFRAENKPFCLSIWVRAVAISPKTVHLLIEVVDGYRMHLSLTIFIHFGLVCLGKGNKVVVLFDSLIFLNGKLSDVDLWVYVYLDLIPFKLFGQPLELILATL